eukprot:2492469-Ditylum_brightwellii.AAC.1
MTIGAPAVEDIKVGFAHQTLDKINVEPQYADIEKLQHQCVCNATTLESMLGGGNNGLAGLAEFPAVYLPRTGHAFVQTLNPGDLPIYPPHATPSQCECIKNIFDINKKNYDTCWQMDLLLKNQIKQAIKH